MPLFGLGSAVSNMPRPTHQASPHPVCVACTHREVGFFDLVCDDCRPGLEQVGLLQPRAQDTRIQIGPTDV